MGEEVSRGGEEKRRMDDKVLGWIMASVHSRCRFFFFFFASWMDTSFIWTVNQRETEPVVLGCDEGLCWCLGSDGGDGEEEAVHERSTAATISSTGASAPWPA